MIPMAETWDPVKASEGLAEAQRLRNSGALKDAAELAGEVAARAEMATQQHWLNGNQGQERRSAAVFTRATAEAARCHDELGHDDAVHWLIAAQYCEATA